MTSPVRVLAAVATLVLVASCSSGGEASPPTPTTVSPAAADPGELLEPPTEFVGYSALDELTSAAVTVRYRSTSARDGSPTAVTGVVFVPNGTPPDAGWPVVAIGHATSGTASRCAPSTHMGLLGTLPSLLPFLANGYLVTMTDYEGLGTADEHPYLDARTAGYNVLDSVRAARAVTPDAGARWVGYGVSQGGQAVWAANEAAANYAGELSLLGTLSASPATDLSPIVDEMVAGTLTEEQIVVLPSLITGMQVVHPDLVRSDYLRGQLGDRTDVFAACEGENTALQADIAARTTPADYAPVDDAAADRLRDWLREARVPTSPASAPMFVGYGEEDRLTLPQWTIDAARDACELGSTVLLRGAPGQGHGILDFGAAPAEWFRDRFAGLPAPTSCAEVR
ncbi:lipase family protein [Rhodococcoides corynebacterioides]|uniref:lipase family protein n=1 Tax=Rhodococcoides corynebacterioides TaxID=53972 RepID=UPI003AE472E5